MEVVKLQFSLRPYSRSQLPAFKGPLLRGAIGYAIRRLSCVREDAVCEGCRSRDSCLYVLLFAPRLNVGRSAPTPVVLTPPPVGPTIITPRDTLDFQLTLFGRAIEAMPLLIAAVINAAETGLGRDQRKFKVEKIETLTYQQRVVFFDSTLGYLCEDALRFSLEDITEVPVSPVRSITVELLTPTQLTAEDRAPISDARQAPFRLLLKQVLGRLSTLYHLFGNGAPAWDYPNLLTATQTVMLSKQSRLYPCDVYRTQMLTKRSERIPAWVGMLEYTGLDLSAFVPYLMMGEIAHIGRRTLFGLGHYRTIWIPACA